MNTACHEPILIIEGEGDRGAVPILIRRTLEANGRYSYRQVANPIERQNIPKLGRTGELERFVQHGLARDGDSVLVILDSDSDCPKEVADDFVRRTRQLFRRKRVGFCFLKPEFEAMFLACLDQIAELYPDYGWNLAGWRPDQDFETGSGSKGQLSAFMKKDRAYKETRDQPKFAAVMDLARLRLRCRAYRHFESLLIWLTDVQSEEDNVYPRI